MAKKNKRVSSQDFTNFLVDQIPHFDEEILKDIHPSDGWILHVPVGTKIGFFKKLWWLVHCLWIMIPWLFRRTTLIDRPVNPVDVTQDRFNAVYPNASKKWTKIAKGSKRRKKK